MKSAGTDAGAAFGTRLRQISDKWRARGTQTQRASIVYLVVEWVRCLWEGNKGFLELEIVEDGDLVSSRANSAGNIRVVLVLPRDDRPSGSHEKI
jgi:hypothetical protein